MMPAGLYYVGDLAYVLHDEWYECCNLFFRGRTDRGCNEGEFNLKDGRRFANFNTVFGDGEYIDNRGRSYGVDSGSIGCVLLTDIDLENADNFLRGGQVVDFPQDFEVYSGGGILYFGSLQIDTYPIDTYPGWEEEEDEEWV